MIFDTLILNFTKHIFYTHIFLKGKNAEDESGFLLSVSANNVTLKSMGNLNSLARKITSVCPFKFLRVSIVIIIQCIYKHDGDTPSPLRTDYRLTTKNTRTEYRLKTIKMFPFT